MDAESIRLLEQAVLVTGNADKLAEARRLCGARLDAVDLDLPEIQSLDLQQVLTVKAEAALAEVGRPVVVEDTGLELAALNGFPGVLVKWMLSALGADGIARTALRLGDPQATARCGLLYRSIDRTVMAEGVTRGRLVLPPRGVGGFGWDAVFLPDGAARTYGEMSGEDKDRISHRGNAWRNLERLLSEAG